MFEVAGGSNTAATSAGLKTTGSFSSCRGYGICSLQIARASVIDRGGLAQPIEPPCTDPYARWCGRGQRATAAPMPINRIYQSIESPEEWGETAASSTVSGNLRTCGASTVENGFNPLSVKMIEVSGVASLQIVGPAVAAGAAAQPLVDLWPGCAWLHRSRRPNSAAGRRQGSRGPHAAPKRPQAGNRCSLEATHVSIFLARRTYGPRSARTASGSSS